MLITITSSSSSLSSPAATHRRQVRHTRRHRFAAFASLATLKLDRAQSLLMPHSTTTPTNIFNKRVLPFSRRNSSSAHRPHDHDETTTSSSSASSSTALHLWGGFDKFLQPYGVSNRTTSNQDEDETLELLNALLPRLPTKEEKARILEGFQRARLDEQLRLSKLSKRKSGAGGEEENDGEENASSLTDLFQRARLAEQLRLSKRSVDDRCEDDEGDMQNHLRSDAVKDEAFQRALLGERLNVEQLQPEQRQSFISTSDSIEEAMVEFENERAEEAKSLQTTMTMTKENDDHGGSEYADNAVFIESSTLANDGHSDKTVSSGENSPFKNRTGEDAPFQELSDKLEELRRTVSAATASTTPSSSLSIAHITPSSMQRFLSTTHLPLPPREDASSSSLVLAPMAHLLTSVFLIGASAFYAVIAMMDVLWNDHKSKACLREASSVGKICWGYVFPKAGVSRDWKSTVVRIARALQTSIVVSFLVSKCILMRAAKHSKHANECMDAGTGALRYLVYALRSANVVRTRVMDSLVESFRSGDRKKVDFFPWRHKLNPRRRFSNTKDLTAQRFNQQRSLQEERQHLRSNEIHTEKLRMLNLDRLALERGRQDLYEAQQELELDKRKLQIEGVNLLAWYSAACEAAVVATKEEAGRQAAEQKLQKKSRWRFWSGRKDGQQ